MTSKGEESKVYKIFASLKLFSFYDDYEFKSSNLRDFLINGIRLLKDLALFCTDPQGI